MVASTLRGPEVDVVELGAAVVTFPEQQQVPVGHGYLLGEAFLSSGKPLAELLALLGVEPVQPVPVVFQVAERGEGACRGPGLGDRRGVSGDQHGGVLVGPPASAAMLQDLPGCPCRRFGRIPR